jgi:hypothetical protein
MKVNIKNRAELSSILDNLSDATEAKWGLMKPQHMIEHLIKTLEFSNGKKQLSLKATEQEAKKAKELFIYTDMEMPRGMKSSLLGDTPDPLRFSSLDDAKRNLIQELDDFEIYFKNNPDATFIQPRLGSLNYQEWIILHNKHFTHHFKQFDLL